MRTEYHLGFEFQYGVDLTTLSPALREHFVPLRLDEVAQAFIEQASLTRRSLLKTWLHRRLRLLISDYDVNGLLDMYPMHLLSTGQWRHLLGRSFKSQLDVGAGRGDLTAEFASLVQDVHVTEQSWAMRRKLRADGYQVVSERLEELPEQYELVTCLNVLDRTQRPLDLVGQLFARTTEGGLIVIAVPLPASAFYYSGSWTKTPEQSLEASQQTWEQSLEGLVQTLLGVMPGAELCAFSRAPYLSGGDAGSALYHLDDTICVFRKAG